MGLRRLDSAGKTRFDCSSESHPSLPAAYDRAFSLTSGIVGNANANLGRPPRPPGFKKRPNTAGAQPMGGLPIEEFLAVMNGGDSGDLVGKLMQLGISLASNAG